MKSLDPSNYSLIHSHPLFIMPLLSFPSVPFSSHSQTIDYKLFQAEGSAFVLMLESTITKDATV